MRKALQFFSQNTVDCYNISLNGFLFYFIRESTVVFLTKHCQLLQRLSSWVFFLPKLSLFFFFVIFSWQRIQLCNFFCFFLTEKLNHVAKALYLSSHNTVDCYKSFCSGSKFFYHQHNFFSVMIYLPHIPLVYITYLALVHNYNTIKCICFISPRQRTNISSRYILDDVIETAV